MVFDCDGTLADTETLSDQAWRIVLRERGYEATLEDFHAVIGHPFPQNYDYFSQRVRLEEQETFRRELRGRFQQLLDERLEVHDDAVAALIAAADAGVPVAVASSSTRGHVERVLAVAEITDRVSAIVGADEVERHKPHPEPYLAAAAALGCEPTRCHAVEDTAVGVASSTAAGMFTIGLQRDTTPPGALTQADLVVVRLEPAHLRRC